MLYVQENIFYLHIVVTIFTYSCEIYHKTRLISIESQPKKVVVVVLVVVVVFAVVIIIGHKTLTLKFDQNRVHNR